MISELELSRFSHEFDNQTLVHPAGLAALVVLGVATLWLPRRYAILPTLVLACLVPAAQRVVAFGLDLTILRLIIVCGWLRLLLRQEVRRLRWTPLDLSFVAWTAAGALIYSIREGTLTATVFSLGGVFDALGIYFLVRTLIRTWSDLDRFALGAALVSIFAATLFAIEWSTERNLFSSLGGVPAITEMREGRLRCQGAFAHPVLAGCFWASLLPLIVARWWQTDVKRVLVVAGFASVLLIVVACASSTPVLALAGGAAASCLFRFRFSLRWVRWGLVVVLATLHLVMKAPVWHLVARVDVVGGSTGRHRYLVLENFINRIDEWWLLGVGSTAHWGPHLFDITNLYAMQGIRGGLLTLALFITVLTFAYRQNGLILRRMSGDLRSSAYSWALGISLVIHCFAHLSTYYYGQIVVVWFGTFAIIASLSTAPSRSRTKAETIQAAPPGGANRPAPLTRRSPLCATRNTAAI